MRLSVTRPDCSVETLGCCRCRISRGAIKIAGTVAPIDLYLSRGRERPVLYQVELDSYHQTRMDGWMHWSTFHVLPFNT